MMLTLDTVAAGDDALDAIKTYLRLTCDDDDATLAALGVAAIAACEAFTGRVLIARGAVETIAATSCWTRLSAWQVTAITTVTAADGVVLAPGSFAIDVLPDGGGAVRVTVPGRVSVAYRAGTAARWSDIPEPLRQGLLAFVAARYAARDGGGGALPPDCASLWRPLRRLRL